MCVPCLLRVCAPCLALLRTLPCLPFDAVPAP